MTNEETKELTELRAFKNMVLEGGFWLVVNMNDTFGYACADAEEVPVEDLVHIRPLYQQYGPDALNAYSSVKRKVDVLKELRSPGYYDAKEKIQMLKATIPYFCDSEL